MNDKDVNANNDGTSEEVDAQFLDPVATGPFIVWVIKNAVAALIYTIVAFFTKLGLKRWWTKKEVDSDSTKQ